MLKAGDCLLIETNLDKYGYIKSHLFIIVIDPQETIGLTIIVNIATLQSTKHDCTTILYPGDDEFIARQSYVYYGKSRIEPIHKLEALIKSNEAKLLTPLTEDILNKVREGIIKSSYTPIEVVELYQDYLYRMI